MEEEAPEVNLVSAADDQISDATTEPEEDMLPYVEDSAISTRAAVEVEVEVEWCVPSPSEA
jgi:hypothetical protein